MLLAYSTWGMMTTPIEVAVPHCAALGFDGLELTVIPRWTTDAATLDAAKRRHIRKLYDDHRIDLCGLSGNTPLLADCRAEVQENLARFKGYLDLAAELQHPGEALTVTTTSAGGPDEWEALKHTIAERFGEVAAHAERAGVVVGAEPHVGQALHTPEQALWLVRQVNSPALTIHFDISHFNVQGMDMDTVVAQLAPVSRHTEVRNVVSPTYSIERDGSPVASR